MNERGRNFFRQNKKILPQLLEKTVNLFIFGKKCLIKLAKFNRKYNMEYLKALINIFWFIKHHLDRLLQIYSRFILKTKS